VPVLELDRKHCVRQRLHDRAFHFDRISFRHSVLGPFLTRNAGPGGPTHERVAYQKQADYENTRQSVEPRSAGQASTGGVYPEIEIEVAMVRRPTTSCAADRWAS
jgi:hypothetical protein